MARQSLRTKLMAILGIAAVAFAALIAINSVLAERVEHQLSLIQETYIPQVELGPQIQSEFEQLRRNLEDAVAARDMETLAATRTLQGRLTERLVAARNVLRRPDADALRAQLDSYYTSAYAVSARLIRGETGPALGDAIADMQAKHITVTDLLTRATRVDQRALTSAFTAASQAQVTASNIRFLVSVGCMMLVLALAALLSRGFLRSVRELSAGFERFGKSDFGTPIPALGSDELGQLAQQANRMAESLRMLSEERDRADWLKNGHAGLVYELRGERSPEEVANLATRFLARYLDAPAALLYAVAEDGSLSLLGNYAAAFADGSSEVPRRFAPGEGVVGQAAREREITIVRRLPSEYLRVRSGSGECAPDAVVLFPLLHLARVTGVLELAVLKPWSELSSELLSSVRETLAIALDVAHARSSLRDLLRETQAQAARLAAQEDELRAANEELQSQQGALQRTNGELVRRTEELERQSRALERNNVELSAARESLERKARELSTMSAYKTQFLANMSHELRTPLNSMLLLSSLLAENDAENLTGKQVEYCRTIHGAGKDLLALINQVLDLAKVEAGKQEVHLSTVRPQELSERARRLFEPLAHDKQLDFAVELDQALPEHITTDPKRVDQILNNLLGNAIKFTAKGRVTLTLRRPARDEQVQRADLDLARSVVLEVSDTGAGIPLAHQARIFAPFEQLDVAPDRRYGGTGLGLTIARELSSLLGGELQLKSAEGRGSTFSCFLPISAQAGKSPQAAAPDGPRATESQAPARLASGEGRRSPVYGDAPCSVRFDGRRLLLADDDMRTLYALSALLRDHGAEVVTADSGRAALEALSAHPGIDAVLMDIMMPEMDGLEAIRRIRAEPRFAHLPIIAVTAKAMAADREECLEAGATAHLPKPIDSEQLCTLLRTQLAPGWDECAPPGRTSEPERHGERA